MPEQPACMKQLSESLGDMHVFHGGVNNCTVRAPKLK